MYITSRSKYFEIVMSISTKNLKAELISILLALNKNRFYCVFFFF